MVKKNCVSPEDHSEKHLCSLRARASDPHLAELFSDPHFVCANCGLRVNKAENVCNPKPF